MAKAAFSEIFCNFPRRLFELSSISPPRRLIFSDGVHYSLVGCTSTKLRLFHSLKLKVAESPLWLVGYGFTVQQHKQHILGIPGWANILPGFMVHVQLVCKPEKAKGILPVHN